MICQPDYDDPGRAAREGIKEEERRGEEEAGGERREGGKKKRKGGDRDRARSRSQREMQRLQGQDPGRRYEGAGAPREGKPAFVASPPRVFCLMAVIHR